MGSFHPGHPIGLLAMRLDREAEEKTSATPLNEKNGPECFPLPQSDIPKDKQNPSNSLSYVMLLLASNVMRRWGKIPIIGK